MRRAAFQAARSVRRPCLRKLARSLAPSHSLVHSGRARASASASPTVLASSMHFRAVTGALVAAAVASGAFYAYTGNQAPSPSQSASPVQLQHASLSTQSAPPDSPPTRKALVVGQGELYTGTISGSGPIDKDTDEYGRRVVEMLDPAQATAKLRKSEESWLIGRGAGVVRYDVVQCR